MRPAPMSTWLFLNIAAAFANTVVFTVAAVYFVRDLGASPFQLVLIGTVMEITVFLFEVPTGAFADSRGRRPAIVVGYVVQGLGLLLAGSVPAYGIVLLGYVVWGIGATFESGALEAWIADEVDGHDLERVFLGGQRAAFAGSLLGLPVSIALASAGLFLPFLVGGGLQIALGITLALTMREDRFSPVRRSETPAVWARTLWSTAAAGVRVVRASIPLMAVLVAVALHGMHTESLDRLWEAHFLADVGLPPLGELEPVVWFGIIGAIQLLLGFFVAGWLASRSGRAAPPDPLATLIALVAIQTASAVGFALAGSFALALAAYLVTSVARSMGGPILDAWINLHIDSSQRATVLSIVNQSDAVGQWVGGPAIGAVGTVASLRAALVLGAVVLVPVIPLYVGARRIKGHPARRQPI